MGGVCSLQAPAPAVHEPQPASGNSAQQQQQQQQGARPTARTPSQSSALQTQAGVAHTPSPASAGGQQGHQGTKQTGKEGQPGRSQSERVASAGKAAAGAGLDLAAGEVQDVLQAHAGSVLSVADAQAAAQETVEDHISEATELRDRWLAGDGGEDPEQLAKEADVVMGLAEKAVRFVVGLFSKDQQGPEDIQRVELKRTWLEEKFAQYSTLGQVRLVPSLKGNAGS